MLTVSASVRFIQQIKEIKLTEELLTLLLGESRWWAWIDIIWLNDMYLRFLIESIKALGVSVRSLYVCVCGAHSKATYQELAIPSLRAL